MGQYRSIGHSQRALENLRTWLSEAEELLTQHPDRDDIREEINSLKSKIDGHMNNIDTRRRHNAKTNENRKTGQGNVHATRLATIKRDIDRKRATIEYYSQSIKSALMDVFVLERERQDREESLGLPLTPRTVTEDEVRP